MGQYFLWYNHEKKAYVDAFDFNDNVKISGYIHTSTEINNVLLMYLMNEWKGTRVVCFGDYWDPDETSNPFLKHIYEDIHDCPWDYAQDHFENVAVYFKDSWKEEFISEYERCLEYGDEYHGPDLSDPRCFTRDVEFVKYVINHDKHEYFDRFTKHRVDNPVISRWFDPTALLLLAGGGYNEPQFGMWIGDDVEATNDDAYVQTLGYEDCTQKYCDPFFFPKN